MPSQKIQPDAIRTHLMLDHPTTSAHPPPRRNRWRVYRARQRAGVISVPVEVDAVAVEFLIKTGWLAEDQAADRRAIGLALSRILSDSARRR